MQTPVNPRLTRLEILVGTWELTARSQERVMSTAHTTFRWFEGNRFLFQRTDPPSYLVPEWQGAAPTWADWVFGADDHSDAYSALYADSRGVCRTYQMSLEGNRWRMSSRPGAEFFQRFDATIGEDGDVIDGRWEASQDNETWRTDFEMTFRRLPG